MPHPRLAFDRLPAALYAVGDIHGCLEQYLSLEARIAADAAGFAGDKLLVTLGDHIDRGPDSAGVIEDLTGPPPEGIRRLSLMGNHEAMMLDFLADPTAHSYWLDEGGAETLQSYDLDVGPPGAEPPSREQLLAAIPRHHLDWLDGLALLVSFPGWVLVHAGLRPGLALAEQHDEDLLWIRQPFLSWRGPSLYRTVHGHTPGREPVVLPHRIGIDTHCFHTGRLTALRITPDGATRFLSVG